MQYNDDMETTEKRQRGRQPYATDPAKGINISMSGTTQQTLRDLSNKMRLSNADVVKEALSLLWMTQSAPESPQTPRIAKNGASGA